MRLRVRAAPPLVLIAVLSAPAANAGNPSLRPNLDVVDRKPTAVAQLFPYSVSERTLANGLKVIVIPTPSVGLVSYRTVVRTGARDEYEKGSTGFAHFFEHMMFRGTKKYPADEYNRIVTRLGADTNAYTSTDVTVYEFDIASSDLPTVVELEADRFMNLEYQEDAFKTEAGAVYGEYRKNRSSPSFVAFETLSEVAFDVHTYGHTAMGLVEDIKAMPTKFDYSRKFFDRYYRPDNCVIIVAGEVDAEATFALIEAHYGGWKAGYVPPRVKPEPAQKRERRVEVPYEGKTQPHLVIGYRGGAFAPDDPVYVASLVLAELAFGETSDIHRELVLDRQVVEQIEAGGADNRDPGLWGISAVVKDVSEVDGVLAQIDRTVDSFREDLVSPDRLAAVKSNMKYDFLLGLDTPRAVAESAVEFVGVSGELATVERLYATLATVTPEHVRDAAREWLRTQQRTVVIVREARDGEIAGTPIVGPPPKPKAVSPKAKGTP